MALKQVAEKWLPEEIVYRPKASFSAPLRAWVRGDLQAVIRDVLVAGELVDSGMIRRDALKRSSRMTRRAARTGQSRYGSCSHWSFGTATPSP
ncbi:MAG: asparagine synthase-related protein [Streptosporangiaceae bacterium]